jgi:gluconokinase
MSPESHEQRKTVVVVMGVSGSGKSTVGRMLADRLGWSFAEADDFHPADNVAKMTSGVPLADEDRWPWLQLILEWIDAHPSSAIVTCSALRRSYRDVLRTSSADMRFLHLDGTVEELSSRLMARTDHFMSAAMLQSQLATLERLEDDEDDSTVVPITGSAQQVTDAALRALRLP